MNLRNIFLITLFCLSNSLALAVTFEEGVAAYNEKDYQTAFQIFSSLAELGHIDAANNLGTLYQTGTGTTKDYIKAAEYYRLAATAGHEDASFNLSTLYRLGVGLKKDLVQAYAWAIVAARNGESEMIANRDMLEKLLNSENRAKGIELAKTYLSQLKELELSVAWLVPQEIKGQEIPQEYAKYFNPSTYKPFTPDANTAAFNTAVSQTIQPKTPESSGSNLPSGFNLISPKKGATLNTADLNLPSGFSIIQPKYAESNNNLVGDEDLSIPKGFHAIKPKTAENDKHTDSKANTSNTNVVSSGSNDFTNISPKTPSNTTSPSNQTTKSPATPAKNETKLVSDIASAAPLKMSRGEILYRPDDVVNNIPNTTLIRPRRQIPALVTPINRLEIDESIRPMLQSLANANYVSIEQLVAALKIANPDAFTKDGPLQLVDPDTQLIIPDRSLMKNPIQTNP